MEVDDIQQHLSGDVARELDFYRLRDSIASFAMSEEGKENLLAREATADREKVSRLKALGKEWQTYLHSARPQALSAWPPISPFIKLLGIEGAQLGQEQLFALGQFCLAQARAAANIVSAAEEMPLPCLSELAKSMPPLTGAEKEIFSVLDKDGEVRDLPALRAIRARIAALRKEVEGAIRKYTSDPAFNSALQSNVPAFRADRELLAVRADRRGGISGIVHEVSDSGQTLYIEPTEAVRANNELIQEEFHLQDELRKIFRELTAKLRIYIEDFYSSLQTMLLFDATHAAARYQSAVHGIFAEDCEADKEPPAIRGARHPLLGDRAVPVDICFLDGKRVLIITGPNTGGKTVTLKTIALFALLNQAGFPLPADEGTRLPIFSSVFADIGDEQSIDESLSTFSSHMKKVADMLAYADTDSLILLDELGSGTDPQEGGAIAMATLDTLIERGSFVIVTTHHGILKNYGYTNPRCVNASVDFDASTLRPTYRLLMGVPGESHAIDIALRSGLPEAVVEKARSYIASEQADVSTLIKGLTAKHTELDEIQRQERIKNAELAQQAHKLHEREIRAKEREIELLKAEHAESGEFLRQTRSQLENLVRQLREGEITREKTVGVKHFITELTQAVEQQDTQIAAARAELEQEKEAARKEEEQFAANGMRLAKARDHKGASKKKTKQRLSNTEALATASVPEMQVTNTKAKEEVQKTVLLAPGMEVYAGAARRQGTLVAKNKNGTWSVQFGAFKMNVLQSQLMPVPGELQKVSIAVEGGDGSLIIKDEAPKFELRLLGMRSEEALKALEHQLDLCAIHNFPSFSIIHGKGNGILQQAVRDYLSNYPGIKDFSFAPPEEGGTGKTYVKLF